MSEVVDMTVAERHRDLQSWACVRGSKPWALAVMDGISVWARENYPDVDEHDRDQLVRVRDRAVRLFGLDSAGAALRFVRDADARHRHPSMDRSLANDPSLVAALRNVMVEYLLTGQAQHLRRHNITPCETPVQLR